MKLDRNITRPRKGKYALIKLRNLRAYSRWQFFEETCLHHSKVPSDAIDFGNTDETDFFVIRLKDKFAAPALRAYAKVARKAEPEYANEILLLAKKADELEKRMPD